MSDIASNTETITTERVIYTAAAEDTSQMTGVVQDGIAIFTVGGGSVNIPLESLPAFCNLVSLVKDEHPAPATPPPADSTPTSPAPSDPPVTDPAPTA